jgi:hypothetical protein
MKRLVVVLAAAALFLGLAGRSGPRQGRVVDAVAGNRPQRDQTTRPIESEAN